MKLKPGWLQRQFDNVNKDIAMWPAWMRREAGFEVPDYPPIPPPHDPGRKE